MKGSASTDSSRPTLGLVTWDATGAGAGGQEIAPEAVRALALALERAFPQCARRDAYGGLSIRLGWRCDGASLIIKYDEGGA